MKRISWDEYFLIIATVAAFRSKDPITKVGAVLVKKNKIIGTGYNGMPLGNDKDFTWEREVNGDTKYNYVIHAEMNAILNTTISPNGSTLYITLFPCSNCAKHLVQAGIKEIIYVLPDEPITDNKKTVDQRIAKKIFVASNVKIRGMSIKAYKRN